MNIKVNAEINYFGTSVTFSTNTINDSSGGKYQSGTFQSCVVDSLSDLHVNFHTPLKQSSKQTTAKLLVDRHSYCKNLQEILQKTKNRIIP